MDLRRMTSALREDLHRLLERDASHSTATAGKLAANLASAVQQAAATAKDFAGLVGSLETLSAEDRKKLAATFKELHAQNTREKALLSRLGAILLVKDLVSMPAGSTGYS